MESVDFLEAMELLSKWAGLKMPQIASDPDYSKKVERKKRILEALETAREFYCKNLFADKNKVKLDYLLKRGITKELIETFNIGASTDWNEAVKHLNAKGFDDELLVDAGIAAKNERGNVYDAMADRITFSVFDIYGSCIGFTGRTLSDNKEIAKYRNTAQTMVFDKSNIVYGVDVLKARKRSNFVDKLVVVEGNVDVVSLVGAGFANTLACMGTALTQFHARIFKRFSDQVYICFDGDSAGRKATLRGLDVLQSEHLNVRVIELPLDSDPDDFVRKQGAKAFQDLIDNAQPLIDYKLGALEADTDMKDNIGRAKYLKDAVEILKALDVSERELYISKVAAAASLTQDAVLRALGKFVPKKEAPEHEKLSVSTGKFAKATEFVLASIIHKKPFAKFDGKEMSLFTSDLHRRVAEMTFKEGFLISDIFDEFEETCQNLESMLNYDFDKSSEDELKELWHGCMKVLRENELRKRLDEITKRVSETENTKERDELLPQIADILKQLKG